MAWVSRGCPMKRNADCKRHLIVKVSKYSDGLREMKHKSLRSSGQFLNYIAKICVVVLVIASVPRVISAQQKQESLADTAYRLRLQGDLQEFCAKKPSAKVCKNPPEEMAKTIIRDRSPEQISKLVQHMETVTGNDHTWVDKAGGITSASASSNGPSENENNPSGMTTGADQPDVMGLSCADFAKSTLVSADAGLDVPFTGRDDWERDLCRARTKWHDQYVRWEGHKGTYTEPTERKAMLRRWRHLQDIAAIGADKAQYYVDNRPM